MGPRTASDVPEKAAVAEAELVVGVGLFNDTDNAELSTGKRGTPCARTGDTRAWAMVFGVAMEKVSAPHWHDPDNCEDVLQEGIVVEVEPVRDQGAEWDSLVVSSESKEDAVVVLEWE